MTSLLPPKGKSRLGRCGSKPVRVGMWNLRAIERVLVITLILNLVATLAKLIVGYLTGTLSLIADGFDSLFDSASNIVGWVGINIAAQPADEEHPYGHRKFETFTAVGISLLLFLTCWELIKSAWERLTAPQIIAPEVNAWSFGALLVSIAVHIVVVIYESGAGRRLKSEVLVADAMHTRADIYVSLSVIAGLVVVRLGVPIVDPILALIIAVLIAKIGLDIIRSSSRILLDRAVLDVHRVERIVLSVDGVRACHRIRSRGQEDDVYLDLHIKVDPQTPTERAHKIAHQVQRRLQEELDGVRDVIVHIEPMKPH